MTGGIIKCTKCGTLNDSELFYCTVCKFNLRMVYSGPPFVVERPAPVSEEAPAATTEASATEEHTGGPGECSLELARLRRRYRDAYTVATLLVGVGSVVKIVGVVVGIGLGLLLAVAFVDAGLAYVPVGLLAGGLVGLFFYTYGLLLAAQGQMLRASLDAAVAAFPLVPDQEKLAIMGV